jgi:hypothetical protein
MICHHISVLLQRRRFRFEFVDQFKVLLVPVNM